MVVIPTRINWRAVLYLEMAVGMTSAEGMEKSQYLLNVFYFFPKRVNSLFQYVRFRFMYIYFLALFK